MYAQAKTCLQKHLAMYVSKIYPKNLQILVIFGDLILSKFPCLMVISK